MFVFCFFFFKQKTAYEMRISDWSSDVCSSDLLHDGAPGVVGTCGDTNRIFLAVSLGDRLGGVHDEVQEYLTEPCLRAHHDGRRRVVPDDPGSIDRKSVV